ncbi:MAG: hypothetical protein PWP23_26 [Candidatus Sumerlaeota bacterium]|nr:hypothetical protein [Candidatus Sumerlaeota bacterium]
MIALLIGSEIPARLATRHLFDVRPAPCGPFAGWRGETRDGRLVRIACPPPRIDDLYVAGRLLSRFGADVLIHLGKAAASPAWLRESGFQLGDLAIGAPVYNLTALEPLQRLLPDTCREIPVPLPEGVPGRPLKSPMSIPEALPLASTALPLTVPHLADMLFKSHGIAVWDTAAAGLAEAAAEEKKSFLAVRIVHTTVAAGKTMPRQSPVMESRLRQQVDGFMQEFGLATPAERDLASQGEEQS